MATFLALWNGAAAQLAASIMGGIVGAGASSKYTGGDIRHSFTNDVLPNLNLSI